MLHSRPSLSSLPGMHDLVSKKQHMSINTSLTFSARSSLERSVRARWAQLACTRVRLKWRPRHALGSARDLGLVMRMEAYKGTWGGWAMLGASRWVLIASSFWLISLSCEPSWQSCSNVHANAIKLHTTLNFSTAIMVFLALSDLGNATWRIRL